MIFRRKRITQTDIKKIQAILDEVIRYTPAGSDFSFSHFVNHEKFQNEIEQLKEEITTGDKIILTTIAMHFAPTSSFQELSLQNGWDQEFLHLSERFDRINEKY